MTTVIEDLLTLTDRAATRLQVPSIDRVVYPDTPESTLSKYSKFGLLLLADGSAGFFYRLNSEAGTPAASDARLRSLLPGLTGAAPAAVAHGVMQSDPLLRGFGMAAINALSQHVFRRAGLRLQNQHAGAPFDNASHIGMVGYFGPTVAALRRQGRALTVLELDETLFEQHGNFVVTGNPAALDTCDYILCTASTLLNHTLDHLLSRFAGDRVFELIGPTCGCFADPLFARGVQRLGSSVVTDCVATTERVQRLLPWGDSVRKYTLTPQNYPGFETLLDAAC